MSKYYRVMSLDEYNKVDSITPIAFKKRMKWFTKDIEFIRYRVCDGKFNNSNYDCTKYTHLIEYEIIGNLQKVTDNEYMLDRRKMYNIKVKQYNKLGEVINHV